jgi:hypothetical protein
MDNIHYMRDEMATRASHKNSIRALLSDGRWHSMSEMERAGGMRYGARLFELRHHDRLCIEVHRIKAGAYEYRLAQAEGSRS